jgi:hypothetical protein
MSEAEPQEFARADSRNSFMERRISQILRSQSEKALLDAIASAPEPHLRTRFFEQDLGEGGKRRLAIIEHTIRNGDIVVLSSHVKDEDTKVVGDKSIWADTLRLSRDRSRRAFFDSKTEWPRSEQAALPVTKAAVAIRINDRLQVSHDPNYPFLPVLGLNDYNLLPQAAFITRVALAIEEVATPDNYAPTNHLQVNKIKIN